MGVLLLFLLSAGRIGRSRDVHWPCISGVECPEPWLLRPKRTTPRMSDAPATHV